MSATGKDKKYLFKTYNDDDLQEKPAHPRLNTETHQLGDVETVTKTDQFLSLGIQYSSINNTSNPICSFNSYGSTDSVIGNKSIFIYQNKIVISDNSVQIDLNTGLPKSKVTGTEIEFFLELEQNYNISKQELSHLISIAIRNELATADNNVYKSIYCYLDGVFDGVSRINTANVAFYTSITFYPGNYVVNLIESSGYENTISEVENGDPARLVYNPTSNKGLNNKVTDNTDKTNSLIFSDNDVLQYYYCYREKIMERNTVYDKNDTELHNQFSKFSYDRMNYVYAGAIENGQKSGPSTEINNIAKYAKCPVMMLEFIDTNRMAGKSNSANIDESSITRTEGKTNNSFRSWIDTGWSQEEDTGSVPVKVYWSDGKNPGNNTLNEIKSSRIKTQTDLNVSGSTNNQKAESELLFNVEIQGSSTKGYRGKNLELYAPKSNNEGMTMVYTPNNDNDVTNTKAFYAEQSFTLKADVVDSSHTNNNCMGDFVNKNTIKFADAIRLAKTGKNGNVSKYANRLKNCLTGFPFLMFIHVVYQDNSSNNPTPTYKSVYYYFGIYNFNLGRKSYFNLGYQDMSIQDEYIQKSGTGFRLFEIPTTGILPDVEVGEIQSNNELFDFSQYDNTVLFGANSSDTNVMWGDFLSSGNSNESTDTKVMNTKENIQLFTKTVAKTGGWIFSEVGHTFSDKSEDDYGYKFKYSATPSYNVDGNPIIQVPNWKYQCSRYIAAGSEGQATKKWSKLADKELKVDETTLRNAIMQYLNPDGTTSVPMVDYKSLAEYYTICMAFGLVDSVQKNLNIKSWNGGKTWYTAFYDMDTCLGISNSGSRINFFAFSDFWDCKLTKSLNNDGTYDLSSAKIYRDYSPIFGAGTDESTEGVFDVPSSYLFAIAKYANVIYKPITDTEDGTGDQNSTDLLRNPTNYWGILRSASEINKDSSDLLTGMGALETAEKFLKNYFIKHLEDIPLEAINYNYRFKYFKPLLQKSPRAGYTFEQFDGVNYPKFHGRKIYYTQYWLDGRFHILDAYFNVNGLSNSIINGDYKDSVPGDVANYNVSDGLRRNNDVYMLTEIFRSEDQTEFHKYDGNKSSGVITVEALPYTTMVINIQGTEYYRYIFPANTVPCNIELKMDGNVSAAFFGSKYFTRLYSINNFITAGNTLYLNSKYLDDITGNNGTCTFTNSSFEHLPSIKSIELTSQNYNGSLSFTSDNTTVQYQNLQSIDLSNTSIDLNVQGVPITKLYMQNMNNVSLNVGNSNSLKDVKLSGKFKSINIQDVWSNDVYIPTGLGSTTDNKLYVQSMSLSNSRWYHKTETEIVEDKNGHKSEVPIPDCKLHIGNNTELTTLNLSGFSEIYIENCPKLQNIIITDPQHVKKLSIKMPSDGSMTNGVLNLDSYKLNINSTNNIVDLSKAARLQYISLPNCNMEEVILAPNVKAIVPESGFANCKNLKYISSINGNTNAKVLLSGPSTFYNCTNFTLHDRNNPNYVPVGIVPVSERSKNKISIKISLSNTFFIYNDNTNGKITLNACSKLMYYNAIEGDEIEKSGTGISYELSKKNIADVNSFENMFRNQSITYTKEIGLDEQKKGYCSIGYARIVKNIINGARTNGMYNSNNIQFLNKYWYKDFSKEFLAQNRLYDISYIVVNIGHYATIDCYEEVISCARKLTTYYTSLHIVDNNGNSVKYIKLNDLFCIDKSYTKNFKYNGISIPNATPYFLNEINTLSVNSTYTIGNNTHPVIHDLTDLFDKPTDFTDPRFKYTDTNWDSTNRMQSKAISTEITKNPGKGTEYGADAKFWWHTAHESGISLNNVFHNTLNIPVDMDNPFENYEGNFSQFAKNTFGLFRNIKLKFINNTFSSSNNTFYNVRYENGDVTVDTKTNKYVNIYTMFDWSTIETTCTNLLSEGWSYGSGNNTQTDNTSGVHFPTKIVQYEEFLKIWSYLFRSRKLQYIGSLFANTYIFYTKSHGSSERLSLINENYYNYKDKGFETFNEYKLKYLLGNNTPIIALNYTFSGIKFVNSFNDISNNLSSNTKIINTIPIDLRPSFTLQFPKVIKWNGTFSNILVNHTVPFNFFNSRIETVKIPQVYETSSNVSKNIIIKIGNDYYVCSKVVTHQYKTNNISLFKCFYNQYLYSNELNSNGAFDITADYNELNTGTAEEIINSLRNYAIYTKIKVSDPDTKIYNTDKEYNGSSLKNGIVYDLDSSGNKIVIKKYDFEQPDEFYKLQIGTDSTGSYSILKSNIIGSESIKITTNNEIQDLTDLYINKTVTSTYTELTNIHNGVPVRNPRYVCPDGYFISPDVLYSVISNGTSVPIMYTICSNMRINDRPFTGIIPKNLIPKSFKNMNCMGLLNGLNITPICLLTPISKKPFTHKSTIFEGRLLEGIKLTDVIRSDESKDFWVLNHKYYYYVPYGFSMSINQNNMYNFNIILPEFKTTGNSTIDVDYQTGSITKKVKHPTVEHDIEHFYIFFDENYRSGSLPISRSIPASTSSIEDALPKSIGADIGKSEGTGDIFWHDIKWSQINSYMRYNIMGRFIYDLEQGTNSYGIREIQEGIDKQTYNLMKLDNLIVSNICRILSGRVLAINSGTFISSTNLSKQTNYVVTNTAYGIVSQHISGTIITTAPLTNNNYFGIGNPQWSTIINRASIMGSGNPNMNYYKNIQFVTWLDTETHRQQVGYDN